MEGGWEKKKREYRPRKNPMSKMQGNLQTLQFLFAEQIARRKEKSPFLARTVRHKLSRGHNEVSFLWAGYWCGGRKSLILHQSLPRGKINAFRRLEILGNCRLLPPRKKNCLKGKRYCRSLNGTSCLQIRAADSVCVPALTTNRSGGLTSLALSALHLMWKKMFITSVRPNCLDEQIETRHLLNLFQGTPKWSMEADKLKIRAAPLPASRDLMVSQFLLTFQTWPSSELFFLLFYIHNLSCHSQNVHNREITFGFMHICVPSWPHAATEKSLWLKHLCKITQQRTEKLCKSWLQPSYFFSVLYTDSFMKNTFKSPSPIQTHHLSIWKFVLSFVLHMGHATCDTFLITYIIIYTESFLLKVTCRVILSSSSSPYVWTNMFKIIVFLKTMNFSSLRSFEFWIGSFQFLT